MHLKSAFNPLIETVATRLFGVDQYPDIFEKLALSGRYQGLLRRLCRRRLASDVASAPLLFVHVPKNGGTSVKRALYRSDPGHASIRYYALFFPDLLHRVPSVAILRDPVDRFLSAFDFMLNGGGGDVRIQRKPLRRLQTIATPDALIDHIENAVGKGGWLAVDTFLRPQSWYLTDAKGAVCIDHLWSLDRAGDGLAAFLRGHGAADLSHANRTRRQRRALSDGQRLRLRALYAEDFALHERLQGVGGYIGEAEESPASTPNRPETLASILS